MVEQRNTYDLKEVLRKTQNGVETYIALGLISIIDTPSCQY